MDIFILKLKIINKRSSIKIILYTLISITISNPLEVLGTSLSKKELTAQLFSAIHSNNLASVRSIISAGANIRAINDEGLTAAGLAVEKGYFNIAHYILGIRNQKSRPKKNGDNLRLEKLNKMYTPSQSFKPKSEAMESSIPKSKGQSLPYEAPKAYKQWPKNLPNPFSPNSPPNKSIPVIGVIQKSPVKSAAPHPKINLKMKIQNSNKVPLKNSTTGVIGQNLAPTPIQSLNKKATEKIDKKAASPEINSTSIVREKEQIDKYIDDTALEEAIDRMWEKTLKIFNKPY
jgi:hypothetical protein